jgi:hypothetical protein
MSVENYPHTAHRWLDFVRDNGPSKRKVAPYIDVHDPEAVDPEFVKSERGALSSIISLRAYQRARKTWSAQEGFLSQPSSNNINTMPELDGKNRAIGEAFTNAMVMGLIREERAVKLLPVDNPIVGIHRRLNELLEPGVAKIPVENKIIINRGKVIVDPSPVMVDFHVGAVALPINMNSLLRIASEEYEKKFREKPDAQTLIRIMNNSYETYIKPGASIHKGDAAILHLLESARVDNSTSAIAELSGESVRFKPKVMDLIRERQRKKKVTRSQTTRCVFLTPTQDVLPFLDEEPEFADPLRDSFDIHMKFLAA